MTQDEIKDFVDCVTYEDCTVQLHGKTYWCLGVTRDKESGTCQIAVWECDPATFVFTDCRLDFAGRSVDECMERFLSDRIWDGKTFYEAAPEMEWVDL